MATPNTDVAKHQNFIPPAVRRQAEEADRIAREASGQVQEPEEGDQAQEPTPQPQPEERPQATNPEPKANGQEPAPQPQAAEEDENSESWKHKFESEKGRTQRLRDDLSRLSDEVTNLRRTLSTVQTAPAPAANDEVVELLTPEEKAEWGEMLPIVEKRARELIAPLQAELKREIESVRGEVTNVHRTTQIDAHAKMRQSLDTNSRINDSGRSWLEINDDDEFIAWLQYPDRFTGQKRHDMLKEAWARNDASRVAAFFEAYVEGATPQAAPRAEPQPGVTLKGNKPSLESFAAPGRARTSSAPPQAGPVVEAISRKDIARFYADLAAGRFKGKEDLAKDYEAKIFAANNAGKVTD
jgi:hypothetical protein